MSASSSSSSISSRSTPIRASGSGSPQAQATTECGQRRQRHRRNQGGRGSNSRDEHQNKPVVRTFIGKEGGLGDEFFYQLTSGNEASDQYARTTEEIVRYTSAKYKQGGDVERSLADGIKLIIPMLPAPQETIEPDGTRVPPPDSNVQVWKMKVNMALQCEALLDGNLESAYSLIKGQCSKPILEKVEVQVNYATVHQDRNPIGLLGLLRAVMYQYNSKKYRAVAIIEMINPGLVLQTCYMSDSEYLEKFRTKLSVLMAAGGQITSHIGMVHDELRVAGIVIANALTIKTEAAASIAEGRFEAALFLMRSNQDKFGRLIQAELANNFKKGRDCYPTTLTAAYEMMLHDLRSQDTRVHPHGNPGLNFHTNRTVTASKTQPNPRPDITCICCNKTGHFSNKCLETKHADGTTLLLSTNVDTEGSDNGMSSPIANVGTTLATIGEGFSHEFFFLNNSKLETNMGANQLHGQHKAGAGHGVPNWSILLDNQSTVDVFCNKSLLRNICKAQLLVASAAMQEWS